MKLLSFLFFASLLLLVVGLGYVAFADISVPQSEIVQPIAHEQIFNDEK